MTSFPFNALGLSHKFISEHVCAGDLCIDGTAGRGRDTLFLSRLVGAEGLVHAFDIQEEAIRSTAALLKEHQRKNVILHLCCHSKTADFVKKESVGAIMFNFGWLPGGDHTKFSRPDTSIRAIEAGLSLLKPGGVMTLCLYHGKETGTDERDAVLSYIRTIDPKRFSVLQTDFVNRIGDVPLAVLLLKDR